MDKNKISLSRGVFHSNSSNSKVIQREKRWPNHERLKKVNNDHEYIIITRGKKCDDVMRYATKLHIPQ